MNASVTEIHHYPRRPEHFLEPLFFTPESRRAVMEHFLKAPWLWRASEFRAANALTAGRAGNPEVVEDTTAHRRLERAHVFRRKDGRAYLVRRRGRPPNWCKRRVGCVIGRWRVVGGWWMEGRSVDRVVFRVELAGGVILDLARERDSGEWLVLGIVD